MTVRSNVRSAFSALPLVCLAAAGLVWTMPAPPASAATGEIQLVRQDLALATDALLTIQFRPPAPIGEANAVIVATYPMLQSRGDLDVAINDPSDLGRSVDSLELAPAAGVGTVTDNGDGTVTITVPTESSARTPTALRFPAEGVYPVLVRVVDDVSGTLGELVTFVDRLGVDGAPDRGVLGVAAIATITAPPATDLDPAPLPADVLAQVQRLAAFPETARLTIDISPDVVSRLDADTLAEVNAVLARSLVVSTPRVPVDPSSAAIADLASLYGKLLREGENEMRRMSNVSTDPTVFVSPHPLTTAGAALLRGLGIRVVIITPDTYSNADGTIFDYFDYSRLLRTRLSDAEPPAGLDACADDCMPTAVIDPATEERLTDDTLEPERKALYLAADLVVWRDWLHDLDDAPVTGHTAVLGLSNGDVPDPAAVRRAMEMASTTGAVESTDLSDAEDKTIVQMRDGVELDIGLRNAVAVDVSSRKAPLLALAEEVLQVSSMLVTPNGRQDRWLTTIDSLYSTGLTEADVSASTASIRSELDAITTAIEPQTPDSFTLSGRRTSVPMRFKNTSDEDLQVRIRLSSDADKLRFADSGTIIEIAAGATREVPIKIEARANGTINVRLELLTPGGDRPIGETIRMTAKVSTLTGLAQVITGGALLILLTWWVRNLRRSRRNQRNGASAGHPSNGAHPDDDAVITEAVITADPVEEPAEVGTDTVVAAAVDGATDETPALARAKASVESTEGTEVGAPASATVSDS
jgi:hypothetical protein